MVQTIYSSHPSLHISSWQLRDLKSAKNMKIVLNTKIIEEKHFLQRFNLAGEVTTVIGVEQNIFINFMFSCWLGSTLLLPWALHMHMYQNVRSLFHKTQTRIDNIFDKELLWNVAFHYVAFHYKKAKQLSSHHVTYKIGFFGPSEWSVVEKILATCHFF